MADLSFNDLPPEVEEGNIEYKLKLKEVEGERLTKLISQASWRMDEGYKKTGSREAIYYIGVNDDGSIGGISLQELDSSIKLFKKIVKGASAEIKNTQFFCMKSGNVAKITIHNVPIKKTYEEITIGLLGPENQGKTTLIGVMSYGINDNGSGIARNCVFRHNHEFNKGETSSIKHELIGYSKDSINNYNSEFIDTWEDIVSESEKIINIIDMPGNFKYIKTTLFCLNGYKIDYVGIIISGNATDENMKMLFFHIMLCHQLQIPYFLIIPKIDLVKKERINSIISIIDDFIRNILKSKKRVSKIDINIDKDTILKLKDKTIFAFPISNVTSENINNLHSFIKNIPSSDNFDGRLNDDGIEFMINDIIKIPEVGLAAIGIMQNGKIHINEKLLIGPFNNSFVDVTVESIHKKQMSYLEISAKDHGSLVVKVNKKKIENKINKHMMIISPGQLGNFTNEFYIVLTDGYIDQQVDDSFSYSSIDKPNIKIGAKIMIFTRNIYDRITIKDIIKQDNQLVLRVRFKDGCIRYIKNNSNIVMRYNPRFLFGKAFKSVKDL